MEKFSGRRCLKTRKFVIRVAPCTSWSTTLPLLSRRNQRFLIEKINFFIDCSKWSKGTKEGIMTSALELYSFKLSLELVKKRENVCVGKIKRKKRLSQMLLIHT